ncbi:MAG: PQQ-dependent sugar dehydrogenase [Flavobacteriaceae bacterium]
MKTFYTCLFSLLIATVSLSQDLELQLVANGFSSPLELKHAGDDRLFVVEQGGRIKILNSDGTINPTPFLNISSSISSGGERGLLGLAFHPDYASNGFFYVYYTNPAGNSQISRFSVSGDPDVADPSSELQMLSFNQPFSNHNGGHIAFGPDGMLYIASGDGGSGGDPQNNAQNLNLLLGKILRLDVDIPAPYIPADNPFVGGPEREEIWAYGVRNPWKFSFDSETDDLWIADVGQNAWEEINKVPSTTAGLNFGWRCYEGNAPFNTNGCPPQSELIFPIAEYSQSGGKCSITGGYVYRGPDFSEIEGLYFFADLCSNDIGTVDQDGNLTLWGPLGATTITSFGVDVNQKLYVVAFGGGSIYEVIDNSLISNPEFDFANSITLHPNPAKDVLNLLSETENVKTIEIIGFTGNLIERLDFQNNKNIQLNVSNLQTGIYILKITSEQNRLVYKKIIIK